MNKAINIAVTAAIVLGISNIAYAKTSYNVTRFDGNDRYETSMKITNNFQSGTLQNIILASGNNFPDALAGSTLSKKYNAPILLINNNVDGLNYIKSHVAKNGNIYILGGTASIKNEYVNSIKNLGYNNIIRLGGANRFDTNKAVIDSMQVKSGTPIVIANGYGFADALSISSVAADNGYPIFMTKADSLPDETKNLISNIKPNKVYIIGGQGSVKDTVLGQIKALVPSLNDSNIIRIDGQTRYETSLNICKYFNVSTDTAVLANGANFPDALSGSALASKLNAPIILTDGHDISNQKTFIDGKGYKNIIMLGGLGSIDLPTEYLLRDPSTITQSDKDYLNIIKTDCESYMEQTDKFSNDWDTIQGKIKNVKKGSYTGIADARNSVVQLIGVLNEGNTYMSDYKNILISLRDKASKSSTPDNLKYINKQYVDNVNAQITTVDSCINYINNYIKLLNSFKDAIDNLDLSKAQSTVQAVNKLTGPSMKNGNEGIANLYRTVTKAINNLQ